jgi:hypothetical protein
MITREQCLQLVSQLWADDYPLVKRYFGRYLSQLGEGLSAGILTEGRFVRIAFAPQQLEIRLQALEPLGQTPAIVAEVGEVQDVVELDRRLLNAWAELRTIHQLRKESFADIHKEREVADLTATQQGKSYVFQVTRITTLLVKRVMRCNPPDEQDVDPFGPLEDIYQRLKVPLSDFFWGALERKNGRFREWHQDGWTRCIVIVSSDDDLQDAMVRHIACQQIREGIHSLGYRHFEELLWLPDLGNGAWFRVGSRFEETDCFADWGDTFGHSETDGVDRRKIDLDSIIPAEK